MAKRENFSSAIICPSCEKVGQASFSENENPVHGKGLDKRVEFVSDGFKVLSQKIFCVDCNVVIK